MRRHLLNKNNDYDYHRCNTYKNRYNYWIIQSGKIVDGNASHPRIRGCLYDKKVAAIATIVERLQNSQQLSPFCTIGQKAVCEQTKPGLVQNTTTDFNC